MGNAPGILLNNHVFCTRIKKVYQVHVWTIDDKVKAQCLKQDFLGEQN